MNKEILKEFVDLEKKHLALSIEYEKSKSYEMSYVALWTILEHIMKPIASIGVKKKLQRLVNEWDDYLAKNSSGNSPKEITNFKTEYYSTSIPPISLIEEAIGDVPKLKSIMDSSKKYRKKRNSIAHRAEKMSEKTYKDYKVVVLSAINELKLILQRI